MFCNCIIVVYISGVTFVLLLILFLMTSIILIISSYCVSIDCFIFSITLLYSSKRICVLSINSSNSFLFINVGIILSINFNSFVILDFTISSILFSNSINLSLISSLLLIIVLNSSILLALFLSSNSPLLFLIVIIISDISLYCFCIDSINLLNIGILFTFSSIVFLYCSNSVLNSSLVINSGIIILIESNSLLIIGSTIVLILSLNSSNLFIMSDIFDLLSIDFCNLFKFSYISSDTPFVLVNFNLIISTIFIISLY